MKGIKKTLMAGVLACTALNAQAEVSPFGYGVKVGGTLSSPVGYNDEARIGGKKADHSFIDIFGFSGKLYGEYAFTDYIGFEGEAGYMKQGGTLTAEEDQKNSNNNNPTPPSISMASHGIVVGLNLCVYPMGREEEEGILKIALGVSPYFPCQTICKQDNQEIKNLSDPQQNQLPGYDVAVTLGTQYEWPFGFALELKSSWGFMNRFTTENKNAQTIFSNASDLKEMNLKNFNFSIGYNIASLIAE